jgi:hypothetical protein
MLRRRTAVMFGRNVADAILRGRFHLLTAHVDRAVRSQGQADVQELGSPGVEAAN